tara:strand:- start:330 stop:752 length:423 start_codon:yes stop_codon:yes gene_type:complete
LDLNRGQVLDHEGEATGRAGSLAAGIEGAIGVLAPAAGAAKDHALDGSQEINEVSAWEEPPADEDLAQGQARRACLFPSLSQPSGVDPPNVIQELAQDTICERHAVRIARLEERCPGSVEMGVAIPRIGARREAGRDALG